MFSAKHVVTVQILHKVPLLVSKVALHESWFRLLAYRWQRPVHGGFKIVRSSRDVRSSIVMEAKSGRLVQGVKACLQSAELRRWLSEVNEVLLSESLISAKVEG